MNSALLKCRLTAEQVRALTRDCVPQPQPRVRGVPPWPIGGIRRVLLREAARLHPAPWTAQDMAEAMPREWQVPERRVIRAASVMARGGLIIKMGTRPGHHPGHPRTLWKLTKKGARLAATWEAVA